MYELDLGQIARLVNIARDQVYTVGDVMNRYSLTIQELNQLVTAGRFPKPVLIGSQERWLERQLRAYEDSLVGA